MNMFFKTLVNSVLVAMMVIQPACAQTTKPLNETEDLLATPIDRPADVPEKGLAVLVNQSSQMISVYKDGQILMESICGTGAMYSHADYGDMSTPNSPTGKPYRIVDKDPHYTESGVPVYENRFGVKMPYPLRLMKDKGYFIHGSDKFVAYHGGGVPQSAGCIRVPTPFASKIYSLVQVGTPVIVIGNPADRIQEIFDKHQLWDLYDTSAGLDSINGLRMKISKPGYTFEDVMVVRKALREGKLQVARPGNTKNRSESYIGFPMFPRSAGMPLVDFDTRIRTKGEKSAGVHTTDASAGEGFRWNDPPRVGGYQSR